MSAKEAGGEATRPQGETAGGPRVNDDPFERAARRERKQKLREEARARSRDTSWDGLGLGSGMGMAVRVFLLPYLVWAAVRFLRFPLTGSIRESIDRFFLGSIPFALATGWILFLIWVWMLEGGSFRRRNSRRAVKAK